MTLTGWRDPPIPARGRRLTVLRAFVLACALLGIAITAAPSAQAASIGQISGHVTDATTHADLSSVYVDVYDSSDYYVDEVVTAADGTYTFPSLAPGVYRLQFSPSDGQHAAQYYNNKQSFSQADPITVSAGMSTTGVDAALGRSGQISGRVTDSATGAPLHDIAVGVSTPEGDYYGLTTLTDSQGRYTIKGLRPGSYAVFFAPQGTSPYARQYSNGRSTQASADPVTVTSGATTSGVDAHLVAGSVIAGTVIDAATHGPIAGAQIVVLDVAGIQVYADTTDDDGKYAIGGLGAGAYKVEFLGSGAGDGNYAPQWSSGRTTLASADTVTTTLGHTTVADAALTPGAQVQGTVTDATTHQPMAGVNVWADGDTAPTAGSAVTDAQGRYTISGLATYAYKLAFTANDGKHASNYYNNKTTYAAADPVALTAGQTKTGIDSALATGGTITGTITDAATGRPVEKAQVIVYGDEGVEIGMAAAAVDGTYAVGGLPAGSFRVAFSGSNGFWTGSGYAIQYHPGAASYGAATPVTVTLGHTTAGIDASMSGGGRIQGTVTDATTHAAIAGATATLYSNGYATTTVTTRSDGTYQFGGVTPSTSYGSYTVGFTASDSNHLSQYYNNVTSFTTATQIAVTADTTTTHIDAALATGARLTGTVKDAVTHAAVSGIAIVAYGIDGTIAGTTTTGPDGGYALGGLAPGAVRVGFAQAGSDAAIAGGYVPQFNGGAASFDAATPLTLTTGATTSGVDASLVPGATIAGTMTSPSGAGLSGYVMLYDASGAYVTGVSSDSHGAYRFTNLPAGTYRAQFSAQGHIAQYYNNAGTLAAATGVAVTVGQVKSGIDAHMSRGGGIAGTVTDAALHIGLGQVSVTVYDVANGGSAIAFATTDGQGHYAVNGLTAGSYRVGYSATATSYFTRVDYLQRYYPAASTYTTATSVSVTAGQQTTGVDTALQRGGDIEGTLTNATTHAPAAGVVVTVYGSDGSFVGQVTTSSDGTYAFWGLPTGSYKVGYATTSGAPYVATYYATADTLAAASTVAVTAGQRTTGIDAALQPLGSITGTVIDVQGGAAIGNVEVMASWSGTGTPPPGTTFAYAFTDADGHYTIQGLATGSWTVSVYPSSSGYAPRSYAQNPVAVTTGQVTSGIDIALPKAAHISGAVTDATTHAGVVGVSVTVFSQPSGTGYSSTYTTSTTAGGAYDVGGLPPGDYKVGFSGGTTDYRPAYHDGVTSYADAKTLTVVAGQKLTGIDGALTLGGHIAGKVTDAANGNALANTPIQVYGADGSYMLTTYTKADGTYVVHGLAPGSYRLQFSSPYSQGTGYVYIGEFYDNKSTLATATPVPVTGGAGTEHIDAALSKGGAVSGTVTDASTGDPISGVSVYAQTTSGSTVGSAITDSGGHYTVTGLAAGSVIVWFGGNALHQGEYYNNATDSAHATPVTVANGATTSGIDAALSSGGVIAGTVKGADTGQPLQGVSVSVYDSQGIGHYGTTDSSGHYNVIGLGTGSFKVVFAAGQNRDYLTQWYPGKATSTDATPVAVTEGMTTSGIDATLAVGGRITGTVTDKSTGLPLTGLWVSGNVGSTGYAATTTDADGHYTLNGLPAGSATVTVGDFTGYHRQATTTAAIAVVLGQTAFGADLALVPTGVVTGTVTTRDTGSAISGASVSVIDSTGTTVASTNTDGNGRYSVGSLSAGTYKVQFGPGYSGAGYGSIYYDGKATEATATPVTVITGAATAGIDGKLFGPPVNLTPPTITGTATQGQTLAEHAGTWTQQPDSSTYRWLRCATSGTTCTTIAGATAQTYKLTLDDAGFTIEVQETATNVAGSSSAATSSATATVLPLPPANTTAPAITGTAQQGKTLTEGDGAWSNLPTSYARQWLRCTAAGASCTAIFGATGTTYVPVAGDVGSTLAVRVTATNAGGASAPATSAVTAVVVPPIPVNAGAPTITGTARRNEVLTEHHGTWTNAPASYGYQWQRCSALGTACLPIAGATSSTYTLVAADIGATIVLAETATNAGGTSAATSSAATAVVVEAPPVNTGAPGISGIVQQGKVLTEAHGSWTNDPTSYAYSWKRCNAAGAACVAISGATASSYTPVAADVGSTLAVSETATNAGGTSPPAVSAATDVVVPPIPVVSTAPTISGTVKQGAMLTEHHGTWSNAPISYTYTWSRCNTAGAACSPITVDADYALTAADVGSRIVVTETATNAGGDSAPSASVPTAVVVAAPPANLSAPTISGTAQQGKAVLAIGDAWTNEPTSFAYTWKRCSVAGAACVTISGATAASYTPVAADVGLTLVVSETATNVGGTSAPAVSAVSDVVVPPVPAGTAVPTITGTPKQGATLTEHHGTWTNAPGSYRYQWSRCTALGTACLPILGADDATYVPVAGDVGATLTVAEIAINSGGESVAATSVNTAVVVAAPPVSLGAPSISGIAQQGQTLTEVHGEWANEPTSYAFQWKRCTAAGASCVVIPGVTAQTYKPVAADVGSTLIVTESATNAGGTAPAVASNPTDAVVLPAPVASAKPTITGAAELGRTLTAHHGTWANAPTSYGHQWLRCTAAGASCVPIDGATEDTYVATAGDVGHALAVQEIATNAGGDGVASTSVATPAVVDADAAPVATLALSDTVGVAPLADTATIAATDADDDPLTYTLSFGDGSEAVTGALPAAAAHHSYAEPGSYLVRLAVSDGIKSVERTATVTVGLSGPLTAAAGDDQDVEVGRHVTLDGGGSSPAAAIAHYAWDTGDGGSSTAATTDHVYSAAGTYTVKLTVSTGGLTAEDTATITVHEKPVHPGLHIHVTGGGSTLPGATVMYVAPDGTRNTATSDSGGDAYLTGLRDGGVSLYVYADNWRPKVVRATVADGTGEASADLDQGEVGATTLESHPMTLDEIKAAGVDLGDPANYHIYEAEIHLYFDPDHQGGTEDPDPPSRNLRLYIGPVGIVCALDCGRSEETPGCDATDPQQPCWILGGYQYLPSVTYVQGHPIIHWLVLPIRASWLKEFYDVKLIVQNLADGLDFSPGVASLQAPAGLSLAPLPTPQSLQQSVPKIPSGQSRTVTWVLRGDKEGSYALGADYSATIDPIGVPLFLHAETKEPVVVYGASKLGVTVTVDCNAERWGPYSYKIDVVNRAPVPVYNFQIEALDRPDSQPAEDAQFSYAPAPPQVQGVEEIKANDGTFTARYTVFAGLGNDEVTKLHVVLPESFIVQTGGDVDLHPVLSSTCTANSAINNAGTIHYAPGKDSHGDDEADLTWTKPTLPSGKTIDSYQLYTGQSYVGPWLAYRKDIKDEATTIPVKDRAVGRFYMLGTKLSDGTVEFMHRIGVGPSRYVALGDSYSAGEGVPSFEPGTAADVTGDKTANKCHRSLGSYSRLLVDDPTVNANLLPVTYAACSGAIANNVTDPRDPKDPNANEVPQDQHVNQFSDLITLSMGGNDIGFRDIGIACAMPMIDCNEASMGALGGALWLANLAKLWTPNFPLALAIKPVTEAIDKGLSCGVLPADVFQILCEAGQNRIIGTDGGHPGRAASPLNLSEGVLVDRLVQVYTDLATRAPNAHIYVQPYPQVADNSGPKAKEDCGLLGPGVPALSAGDRDGISAIIGKLDEKIGDAIDKANKQLGRHQIDAVGASVVEFDDGKLCTGGILSPGTMFNSVVNDIWGPSDNMGPLAYSFHPNKYGQQAYERGLVKALNFGITNHVMTVLPRASADAGTVFVPRGARTVTATTAWPGSTVTMTLVSPSGKHYAADSAGVTVTSTPTSETLVVADPEQGTWRVQLYGDDVAADGEPTQVSAMADVPAPTPPTVSAHATPVAGSANTYDLTAVGPADATYRWTLSDGTELAGALVRHTFPVDGPRWATAVTTGADGQTTWTPVEIRTADATPPTLAGVPSDITREATGSSGTAVTYTVPTATDDVDDTVTPSCAPAGGAIFPVGSTTVTCTATDLSGNTATAHFVVHVVDTTAPKLTGVAAVMTVASGSPVTFPTPTASDLVDGSVPATCSPASGTTFPVGATKVTCTATDAAHNAATASFTVTVTAPAGGGGGEPGSGGSGSGSGGSGSGSGSGGSGSGSGGSGGVTGQGGTAITGITLVTPTAPVSAKGVVTVQLACAKAGGCKGNVKLVVIIKGKPVVLATGTYSAKGKGTKLKLHLTAAGKAKLKKAHGKLKATLQVTTSGTKSPSSLPVTLKR
jgi:hypothetical protein